MTNRIRLVGETPVRECIQLVFGELVKLAAPVVERFHSDLYWDAKWLDAHLEKGLSGIVLGVPCASDFSFFYGVDDHGTSIGTDEELVTLRCQRPDSRLYQLTLECEGSRIREDWPNPEERVGTWYLSIKELERSAE